MHIEELIRNSTNDNEKYFFHILKRYKETGKYSCNDNFFSLLHILRELEKECVSNNLKNDENNKLLIGELDFILRNDFLLLPKNKKSICLIKESIYGKNIELAKHFIRQLICEVDSKKEFNNLVDNLRQFVSSKKANFDGIRLLLCSIINMMLYKGYLFEKIVDIIINLFSSAYISKHKDIEIPMTNFPINYLKGLDKYDKNEDIINYINNMPTIDRLNYLKKIYSEKEKTYYCIFAINGLFLGKEILKLSKNITIYNPNHNKMFSNNKFDLNAEIISGVDYKNNVNTAVKVSAVCCDNAIKKAFALLENSLDIIKLLGSSDNYEIDQRKYIIYDNKKEVTCFNNNNFDSSFEKRKFYREFSYVHYNNVFMNNIHSDTISDMMNIINDQNCNGSTKNKILNFAQKYNEGINNRNKQEAILKYWSALESLFDDNINIGVENSKIDNIVKIVSHCFQMESVYYYIQNLYREIQDGTYAYWEYGGYYTKNNPDKLVQIPDSLLKKVKVLTKDNVVSLKPLVQNLKNLDKYCRNECYYNEILNYNIMLYDNKNFAYSEFKKEINKVANQIKMIYRLRNQIIHNASCNEITIDFYLPILKDICICFFKSIADEFVKNITFDISDVILSVYSNKVTLLNRLEGNTLMDISFLK